MAGGGALPAWTTMEAVGISQELQAELEPAFSREQARTASAAATVADCWKRDEASEGKLREIRDEIEALLAEQQAGPASPLSPRSPRSPRWLLAQRRASRNRDEQEQEPEHVDDLLLAVAQDDEAAAAALLERGVDPNRATGMGTTALMAAASRGALRMVQLLVDAGARLDTQAPINGATAFHYACTMGHPDAVELLVRAGCDTTIRCSDGETGWEWAASAGRAEVIGRLKSLNSMALENQSREGHFADGFDAGFECAKFRSFEDGWTQGYLAGQSWLPDDDAEPPAAPPAADPPEMDGSSPRSTGAAHDAGFSAGWSASCDGNHSEQFQAGYGQGWREGLLEADAAEARMTDGFADDDFEDELPLSPGGVQLQGDTLAEISRLTKLAAPLEQKLHVGSTLISSLRFCCFAFQLSVKSRHCTGVRQRSRPWHSPRSRAPWTVPSKPERHHRTARRRLNRRHRRHRRQRRRIIWLWALCRGRSRPPRNGAAAAQPAAPSRAGGSVFVCIGRRIGFVRQVRS